MCVCVASYLEIVQKGKNQSCMRLSFTNKLFRNYICKRKDKKWKNDCSYRSRISLWYNLYFWADVYIHTFELMYINEYCIYTILYKRETLGKANSWYTAALLHLFSLYYPFHSWIDSKLFKLCSIIVRQIISKEAVLIWCNTQIAHCT